MLTDVFIRRPILSTVLALIIMLAGAIAIPDAADRAVSRAGAAVGHGLARLHRRQRAGRRERRHDAARAGDQRRRGHDLHAPRRAPTAASAPSPSPSTSAAIPTWRPSTCRTASTRRSAGCRPRCAPTASRSRRTRPASWAASASSRATTATTRCSSATTSTSTCATRSSACPAWATSSSSASASYAMRLWLDPGRLAGRGLTAGDVVSALREQNVQVAAGALGDAPASRRTDVQISVRAAGRLTEVDEFENVVVKAGAGRRAGARRGRRPRRARRRDLRANLRFLGLEASGIGVQLLPSANALEVVRRRHGRDGRARAELPAGARVAAGLRQRHRRARVDHRGAEDAGRGHRARRPRDVPVPAELAEHAHSGHHDPGVARSAPSRSSSCSASRSTR